jgi:hypothetical protein
MEILEEGEKLEDMKMEKVKTSIFLAKLTQLLEEGDF